MNKPFAITLDVGSSRANQTGSWRTERPVYVTGCRPATTPARPGRTSSNGCTTPRRATTRRPGGRSCEDNPMPAVMGRVCYRPCETACNRAPARRGGRDQRGRALPRRRGDRAGWQLPRRRGADRASGCWWWRGAVRPVGRLPADPPGSRGDDRDAGPQPGGMMRYGIPKYRLPRDVLDAEIDRILDMGVTLELGRTRRPTSQAERGRAASTPRSWPSALSSAAAPTSRPGTRPGSSTRCPCCTAWREASRRMLGRRVAVYGGGNTAHGRGPHRTAARRDRGRRRLPANPRADAGPRHRGRGGAGRGRHDAVAVHDRARRARASCMIEKMRLDETGFPQPTGEFEELEADWLVLALGQDADLSLLENVPGVTVADGVVEVGAGPDDRPSRHLRRRGHGARRADRDRRDRARQEGRPQHRRLAARAGTSTAPASARSPRSAAQHLVLRRRPGHRAAHAGGGPAGHHVRRGRPAGWTSRPRCSRRAAACRAATASGATTAIGVCPDNAVDQARPTASVQDRLRLLQGLRPVRRRMPLRRHRDATRAILNGGVQINAAPRTGRGRPGREGWSGTRSG